MDRALYVAMSGAIQTLRAQAANHHNLANASTTGFKAELVAATAVQVHGDGFDSRVPVRALDAGTDARAGSTESTGRALDVALKPGNWLAVQQPNGQEAYTRAGQLTLDAEGTLRTASGQMVLGDGGPLTLPPATQVDIGADGTVSIIPAGASGSQSQPVGRLKVVTTDVNTLERAGNGLFLARVGSTPAPANGAVLTSGALESSNVNVADAMVTMIELARQFELQTRAMKAADENAQQASSLVRMK